MMGTRIPIPIIPPVVPSGNPCGICWGVGKPFGDKDTPSTIDLNFSGINKGPNWVPSNGEPIEGLFTLNQIAAVPCNYTVQTVDFLINLEFSVGDTDIAVLAATGPIAFQSFDDGPCAKLVRNKNNDNFTGGSCSISVRPGL